MTSFEWALAVEWWLRSASKRYKWCAVELGDGEFTGTEFEENSTYVKLDISPSCIIG